MDVQAWVMGKGLLEANFKFPLSQPNKQPVITGTLHEMKLNRLNPMFNYVAAVEIESGICHQMDFNFTYDEYQSSGQLAFNYNNLNIHFINDKRGNEERNNNDELLSFISKAIITKTSQRNDNNIRSGKIKFKRDPKKSILNYWWKSLFSGVKSSVIWNLKKEISPS